MTTSQVGLSPVVAAEQRRIPGFTSLLSVDLEKLGVAASPVAVLDDFRVDGLPFSPHPHAGFAAVTYVFEDSPGDVRSRASSGVDLRVGPGGIVWTDAGSGVIHEEVPATPGRALHGLQIFVNLSARNKLSPPRVHHLQGADVPQWVGDDGSRVRVVVGSYAGVASPLSPTEPFTLLDIHLRGEIPFDLPAAHHAIAYVLDGTVTARTADRVVPVGGTHAVALTGAAGRVTLAAAEPAHLLVMAGAEVRDPVVTAGPFIMNDHAQLQAAAARHRAGEMGRLAPTAGTDR
ncbi:pirin family protein [Micromonospora haikouensis]|uniref:pirin family protein n=1 Tax=Micromonospora haikouensis TaxID=686309 RepID=UPI0037930063